MMMEIYRCRVGGGPLESVWDLGNIKPSNFLADGETDNRSLPLHLVKGSVLQLKHEIDFKQTYQHYWYTSGLNSSMVGSLRDIVNEIKNFMFLRSGDVVVDIGSNDGTLLSMFPGRVYKIGFEPARNINASTHTHMHIPDFFRADLFPSYLRARVITSIAMFYDVPDPLNFVGDIKQLLAEDGIWVLQLTDLHSMLRANAFDNICHEHLIYYTLHDLYDIISAMGLKIFKVQYNMVNGGSIRVWVCHSGAYPTEVSVINNLNHENNNLLTIEGMREKVNTIKDVIMDFLYREVVEAGKEVMISGASTKGNTLVQYFGIDNTLIPFAAEVNKQKFGLRMTGSDIKIIPEKEALKMRPDYFFILPWHFKNTFIERYQRFIKRGGTLILPLPTPHLVNKEGEWELS